MIKEFKAGDKVYYPPRSTKVLTVYERNSPKYPIMVGGQVFTCDGTFLGDEELPCLIHATPENHALLEQLFGVEFEAPPVKPTSCEIIKAMLARGDKYVLCRVINCESDDCYFVLIERVFEDGGYIDSEGTIWDCATPFNPRTGTEITELP